MLCVRNIPRAKKFMDQRRGGEYQAFPSKTLSQSAKKNRRVTLLCYVS